MLGKIINSMFYGTVKTKLFLWTMFFLIIGALALLVAAFALGMPMLGIGGAGLGLFVLIASQSVSFNDLNKKKKGKVINKAKTNMAGKNKQIAKAREVLEEQSEESTEERSEESVTSSPASRRQRERAKAQYLSSMDQKKLKKLLKENKVNQIHVKVMIDSYPKMGIEQAPAFIWKTERMLRFLILTEQAQKFEIPLQEIRDIHLVKDVPAEPERDYAMFRVSNFITKMFQPYLPAYFEVAKDGALETKKNTFRIEPGIYLTNSSVGNLRRVLLPEVAFTMDDKVNTSTQFNEYFKEIYRGSVLCKNMVITLDEYKELIEKTLDEFLEAPISGQAFVSTLSDLHKYKLISRDFLVTYTQKYQERH